MTRRRNRTVFALTIAALLLAAAAASAQTITDPVGQPAIQLRAQPSYYVWVDASGWHVRWRAILPVIFSGTVISNGEIRDLQRAGGGGASWLTRPDGQRIAFGTPGGFGAAQGFDFRTTGSNVTLTLLVNGRVASGSQVFVGRLSQNPAGVPFALAASPGMAGGTRERELRVDREEFRNRVRDQFGQ